jgi:hypothetical protein
MNIYQKSWITKYFNVETKSERGVVFFFDNSAAKNNFQCYRFEIVLKIPEITKLYFKPETFWMANMNKWITVDTLSDILNATPSNNAPGTRPVSYDPPYLLIFKIQGVASNYLSFTDFKKPNSESTILAMLRYDEDKLMLKDECTTEIILPYKGDLCLNEVLEFKLYDSKNKLVRVSDKSQLFILLTIL